MNVAVQYRTGLKLLLVEVVLRWGSSELRQFWTKAVLGRGSSELRQFWVEAVLD